MFMKKVVHVQLLPKLSGVQRVSLEEFRQGKGIYEYHLICSEKGDLTEQAELLGVKVHLIKELVRDIDFKNDIFSLLKLTKILKGIAPHIVHTHSSKTGVLGRLAAKLVGVPKIIHTVHGFAFSSTTSKIKKYIFSMLERISGRVTDTIIVLNVDDYNICTNELGINRSKLTIIKNGVDLDFFSPDTEKKVNLTPCFIMVGRLWLQKDPICLVRAAISVLQSGYDAEFKLVGDGELYEEANALLHKANFQSKITLLGWRHDIVFLLQQADVFILPSRWEGMPLAILEAMSCGLPCIVSNIPGNRDLVDDGITGRVFEVAAHLALADKVINYINNPGLMIEHGHNARENVVENYDLNTRNNTVFTLYEGK